MTREVLNYFTKEIEANIQSILKNKDINKLEEIRIRVNKNIILKFNNEEVISNYVVNAEEILEILQAICEKSIYSYQKQICNGYITIKGGHRIGITGNCVIEKNKVVNINYISSLNFRIAKEVLGCSNKFLKYIINMEEKSVYNTLIVSPPGVGKTTVLRDLIRNISNGVKNYNFEGLNVGLVDERGEIAGIYKGQAENDIGLRTDVLDNIPKSIGMRMLIRSMAPKVISADEIGSDEDIAAINTAICSGIKGIFTAHGISLEQISLNPAIKSLINSHLFERIIFLKPKGKRGEIEKVYSLNKKNAEYEELEI